MRVTTLIKEYERILPSVVAWIDDTLHKYQNCAVPVASLRLPRLGHVFPEDLLQRAKVVAVLGTVPLPPLSQMGLTAFAEMEQQDLAGITYKDTFFVRFYVYRNGSVFTSWFMLSNGNAWGSRTFYGLTARA